MCSIRRQVTVGDIVTTISLPSLLLAFIPALVAIYIMYRWSAGAKTAIYASLRMLIQLLLIGYVLVVIFEADTPGIILAVLVIMLTVASWISLRPLKNRQPRLYVHALIAISVGGALTLALVSQAVLQVEPWFSPRYVVPLAGMIFAGSMNAVSLAAERYQAESDRGVPYTEARKIGKVDGYGQ